MGLLDAIFKRNREIGMSYDIEDMALFMVQSDQVHLKRLIVEMCTAFLGRTISQSEFRVKRGGKYVRDEMYYRLNVRPNKNQSASEFWSQIIAKLVWENEVLVIQADDEDLLIADSFFKKEYAVYEDVFSHVIVKDFEFGRTYTQSEVLHIQFGNEQLKPLIDKLFTDYGELFGRIIGGQKRKNQIRGTVDMDMVAAKSEAHQQKLQTFIDNMYKAIAEKEVAIVPQQHGFEYSEKSGNGVAGQSVDEVNKVSGGFLEQLAMVLGIPMTLLKGDMATVEEVTKNHMLFTVLGIHMTLLKGDMATVEEVTKNYMLFTVGPLLKKIEDELNHKLCDQADVLKGDGVVAKKPSYRDIFDLATAVDKLISSGAFNANELRDEVGYEPTDNPLHEEYMVTKNYQTSSDALKGGENENENE
ncbi:phage portal protein [Streptococcus mutans]|nr:phage portal protein [Streptococcus mutans]